MPPGKEKRLKYLLEQGNAPEIKKVKRGDIIRAVIQDPEDEKKNENHKYEVLEVYPYMVRAVNIRNSNDKRCFTLGDLVCLGLEALTQEVRKGRSTEWRKYT